MTGEKWPVHTVHEHGGGDWEYLFKKKKKKGHLIDNHKEKIIATFA